MTTSDVEVVVPVYNEEAALPDSIQQLHAYLSNGFPFSWRITIADNASTDGTLQTAHKLASELDGVHVLHLDEKGRGRALRAAWSASDAPVVCYMDVDLSTDLRALLPLVAPLVTGHSDVSIGSRLAPGARTTRSPKRELISRGYNQILHTVLRAKFSDAQCGFKAARADAVRELLPAVKDQSWFFDTELLVLAQRRGLRIHEVPVDWVEDMDTRVEIVPTARDDLRGVARLALSGQLVRFLAIGAASTLAYALLFLALRTSLAPGWANALALALTAIGNTAANRRITFGIRGRPGAVRHQLLGGFVFLLALGLTSGALAVLHALVQEPARLLEVSVLVVASICATLSRYVCLRWWVFAEPSPNAVRLLGSEAGPRAACGSRPTRSS